MPTQYLKWTEIWKTFYTVWTTLIDSLGNSRCRLTTSSNPKNVVQDSSGDDSHKRALAKVSGTRVCHNKPSGTRCRKKPPCCASWDVIWADTEFRGLEREWVVENISGPQVKKRHEFRGVYPMLWTGIPLQLHRHCFLDSKTKPQNESLISKSAISRDSSGYRTRSNEHCITTYISKSNNASRYNCPMPDIARNWDPIPSLRDGTNALGICSRPKPWISPYCASVSSFIRDV